MADKISDKKAKEIKSEIDKYNDERNNIVEQLMDENQKYGQNIEVINIHNHFGGTQYYGNASDTGPLSVIGKIGRTIFENPGLASFVGFGAMYIGSKTLRKTITGNMSNLHIGDSKKTIAQKEAVKLLESKTVSESSNVYIEKSVFSDVGFTVQANTEDCENIIFYIYSASDVPVIENFMKKKEVIEITFKNLPENDSFVKLLKDLVKCKFHKLIFKENEKNYNLYVSGDLQKDYRITFEKGEEE